MAPNMFAGGASGLGSLLKIGTRGGGAVLGGGLNTLAQLSQEGSEGDINLLSAGLGALQGAMSVPGASESFAGARVVGRGIDGTPITVSDYAKLSEGANLGSRTIDIAGTADPGIITRTLPMQGPVPFDQVVKGGSSGITGLSKAKNLALTGLEKGSDILQAGIKEPFTKAGLKAATIPFSQATGDVMFAEAKRAEDEAEDAAAADDSSAGYTDAAYRAAIRKSMEAYGAEEEEILAAIEAAGYRSGGRVALEFGGIGAAVEKVDDKEMKETMKFAQEMDIPISDLTEEFIIQFKRKPNSLEELKMFYKDKYEYKGPADVKMQETMTERFTAKDGGTPSVLPKGVEADYRGGGFIPIGSKERADDVPARLSENEFVMTADAVRAAGGGSVNQGAKRMYNLMHNLEARA
jgi:hypothetical protein